MFGNERFLAVNRLQADVIADALLVFLPFGRFCDRLSVHRLFSINSIFRSSLNASTIICPRENSMKKTVAITICFVFLSVLVSNATELRTWTSANGTHKTEAEFIKVSADGKTVTIRKTDGTNSDVPLDKLSKEDQEYVVKIATPPKDGPLQPPVSKWAASRYQSVLTRSKNLGTESENALRMEAEKGNTESQIRLGLYYFSKERETDAINWFRKAAERNTQAASYLAVLCFAKQDYEEAKEWTQKIVEKGTVSAKEFLKEIEAAASGNQYGKREANVAATTQSVFVTNENFVRYGDDGSVTIRAKDGSEQSKHINQLSQEDKNIILELEIKSLAVSDKFFSPKQIREQIDAYFTANPIEPEKKMEITSRETDVVYRTIDRSLTPYEINGIVLALMKLQEVFDKKYSEYNFKDVMRKVARHKNPYGRTVDAYIVAKDGYDSIYSTTGIGRAAANVMMSQVASDVRDTFRSAGQLSTEEDIEMMRNHLDRSAARKEEEKKEDERAKQKIEEVIPYCHKFSFFKHQKDETERLKKLEEEKRKKEFEQKSKDLFK